MSLLQNKTESLSVQLPWLRLINHLGVELNSSVLPAMVECPACGEATMQVLPDHLGGEWFSCSQCAKSEDAIQLAARVWDISIPAAIRKLSRDGFEIPTDRESIRNYVDRYVKHRERVTSLWERSRRGHFHNSTPSHRLVHELRFHSEVPANRRADGPGQLYGSIPKVEVLSTYYPKTDLRGVKPKDRPGQVKKFFKGRGWEDLLVLPFRDMPGRISGFYFVGRDGEIEDRFFRSITYKQEPYTSKSPREAGLYFHPDALDVSKQHWHGTVFAVRDPVLAMQLHARHFENSKLPLPLFAWQEAGFLARKSVASDATTNHAWQMLSGHSPVFWMPSLDAAVLKQAAAVNGLISMVGPTGSTRGDLREYIWKLTPANLLQHIASNARPWIEVFASAVTELNDGQVEQLATQIARSGADLTRIINKLPAGPQERLRALLAKTKACVSVPFNREHVIEKDGKWFVGGPQRTSEETILTGILRVNHISYHARTGISYLEGHLIANKREVAFCEAEKTIKKDPLAWISTLARSKGHMLVEGRQAWSKRLLEVAYAFSTPRYVDGVDTIGWDVANARFVLPKFNIHLGGKVKLPLTDLLSSDVPGTKLTKPVKLNAKDFKSVLAVNNRTQTFWACVTPFIANILAPAFARNPSGIAFTGRAASWTGFAIGRAIGCQHRSPGRGCVAIDVDSIYATEFVHNWPLLVGPDDTHLWGKWWGYWANKYDHGYRNCAVALEDSASMLKAVQGGWHVVVSKESFQVPESWKTLAAKLIPAYLKDVAARNFKLSSTAGTTWLADVLFDLIDFVERAGADATAVRSASSILWPSTEYGSALAFVHMLGLLTRSGRCVVAPEGFQKGNLLQLVRRPDGLFIPDSSLRAFLAGKYHELPEHEYVSKMLTTANVLLEDCEDGWLVDEKWWRESQQIGSRLQPSNLLQTNRDVHQPQSRL